MIHSDRTSGQRGLFEEPAAPIEDDPKPNSPDDLGYTTPSVSVYGTARPEPDPMPENFCRSAMQWDDARKFVAWIHARNIPTHAGITLGGIVVGLSGLGVADLRWLCGAIKQAGVAPSPEKLRRAVMTHDVSVLREADDD